MADDVAELALYLGTKFSVNTPEQVIQLKTDQAWGYASAQYRFKVIVNDGNTFNLFVKRIERELNERHRYIDKELGMLTDIVPKVTDFIKAHDEGLAEQFYSSFVKYHGIFRDEHRKHEYLILDDFSCSDKEYQYRNEPKVIVQKLGLINGSLYSWARTAGFTPGEMLKTRSYLTELFTSDANDLNHDIFSSSTSAVYKIVKVTESLSTEASDKLERILRISPFLRKLRHEAQKARQECFCPTLGDVHRGNVAVSRDLTKVLFYDFGNVRLASPLIDFHHYTAGSLQVSPAEKAGVIGYLFGIYKESFLRASTALRSPITEDLLEAEFCFTRNWETITSYFVVLLTLMFEGVGQADEKLFTRRINSLDAVKDRDMILAETKKMGNPAKVLIRNVLNFLDYILFEDIERLEKDISFLKY